MGAGYVLMSTNLPDHPDVLGMHPRTFFSWIRGICWLNQHRDAGYLLPVDVAHDVANKRARSQLCAAGWWVDNTVNYWVPTQDRRGNELWRRGPDGRRRQTIPSSLREAVYERDGHACRACGATENLTLDHVIHWSAGGPDSFENLRTLCGSCNSRRRTKTDLEWLGVEL